MKTNSLRKVWWALTFLYLLAIYTTLGVAPGLWDIFNRFLGGRGAFLVSIVYLMAGVSLFAYMVFVKREKSLEKYLLFFLFVWIFLLLNKLAIYPVEKIHMAKYGGLSVFLYNALKIDLDRFKGKLYLFGSLFCVGAVFLDEVIQFFLPNRFFDWRDIILSGAGSVVVFLVIKFNILKPSSKALYNSSGMMIK